MDQSMAFGWSTGTNQTADRGTRALMIGWVWVVLSRAPEADEHTNSKGCTNWGSGLRRIEAELVGINDKGGQDWRLLCETTPMIWNHITYTSPAHCEVSAPTCSRTTFLQILTVSWRSGSLGEKNRGMGCAR